MKKRQANKFVMLRTVITLLERNEIIVSGISELQAATNLLKTRTIELESADSLKRTALTGKKIFKDSVKESLIRSASGISGAINTYAKKTGNDVLAENSRLSQSAFALMRETQLLEVLKTLKELALTHKTDIVPFGITEEKLNVFIQRLNSYDEALNEKEHGAVARTGAVKSLELIFRETNDVLDSADKLIRGLAEDHPEFVRDYFIARRIKNLGIRHFSDHPPESSVPQEKKNLPVTGNAAS